MQKSVAAAGPNNPARLTMLVAEPEVLASVLAALGIGLLLGAFAFEYLGGIKPCHLCLGQRLPWALMTLIAGLAMLSLRRGAHPALAPAAFVIAAGIALWSIYLAGFHAGVEWKWWPGPPSCTGSDLSSGGFSASFDPAQIVRCDEIAWSLFGLSLAGYNFLFSLVALAAAGAGAIVTMRRNG
jgi:disulfide bond formation protein DsbB